jgi:hypothetical protein
LIPAPPAPERSGTAAAITTERKKTTTLETKEKTMRLGLTACVAAALSLLMVEDASAQVSGVPKRAVVKHYQQNRARAAGIGKLRRPHQVANSLRLGHKIKVGVLHSQLMSGKFMPTSPLQAWTALRVVGRAQSVLAPTRAALRSNPVLRDTRGILNAHDTILSWNSRVKNPNFKPVGSQARQQKYWYDAANEVGKAGAYLAKKGAPQNPKVMETHSRLVQGWIDSSFRR